MSKPHPSYLQLDRMAAGLAVDPVVRDHVAMCAECEAYLRTLQAPESHPDWLPKVEQTSSEPNERGGASRSGSRSARRRGRHWANRAFIAAIAATAATAAITTFDSRRLASGPEPSADFSTIRGEPSVGLYVKRGPRVFMWDGRATIHPGDQLRLKVVPEGFGHLAVLIPSGPTKGLSLVYAAAISPDESHLLPTAWRVNDEGIDEQLVIVLSTEAQAPQHLVGRPFNPATETSTSTWIRALRLDKTKEPPR